jgi:hypothetical protein
MRRPVFRTLPLAALLLAAATGCAGFGNDLLSSDAGARREPAAPLGAVRTPDVLETEPAVPHLEALTATLDRLNDNQERLEIALQDLQAGAARQADAAKQSSEELLAARRSALVYGIIAAAAVLLALLLAIVVVGQSSQVKRATRALADAEAQLEEAVAQAERAAPAPTPVAGRAAREAAQTAAASAAGAAATGGSAAGPAGNGAPGAPAARLRQRPPVG